MFENLQKQVNKQLKPYNIQLSESGISMILGAIVVVIIAIFAYNYFRIPQTENSATQQKINEEVKEGEIIDGTTAVALPTNYTVEPGDNLWNIAEKYYRSGYNFVDIAIANNISDTDMIAVGQNLKIPKVSSRQITVVKSIAPEITLSRIDGNQYVVVEGDNLWEIALRAYGDGYRWTQIAKENNLPNPDWINPGLKLSIPR